ncbi:HNH endonuclease [Corynebacterium aquatimens]|uniref:HNH endonuclease signature motif containing protein n=1 Tax=Corynebacterium aquatimens TaxID=1190508 RepID=UPI0025406247|nr:HNH endonuclease signature motif containing protein [Corynebacterium aquatimens]QYH19367.1 HNH endonuclease [Corynebacterium aquatimens]
MRAVDAAVAILGSEPDPELLALIDDYLVNLFTPTRIAQELPGQRAITERLHRLITTHCPEVGFDEKKRKKRSANANGRELQWFDVLLGEDGMAGLQFSGDRISLATIRESVRTTAKELKTTEADAFFKLLAGEVAPEPTITINVFRPSSEGEGVSAYVPGFGWTDATSTAILEDLIARGKAKEVDLSNVEKQEVPGYAPTTKMRTYAEARDGCCVYPGCSRPAATCQLDHRIPFDEGGPTTPSNLFTLCQTHHNLKTDRRAFYVPDPSTGDIIWLFSDGTYAIRQDAGVLRSQITPVNPRWRSSVEQRQKAKDRAAEFLAKGHALLDEYETTHNLDHYLRAIDQLEREYDMEFPFLPELPWEEPLPEEPVEGPCPDPLYDVNPEGYTFEDGNAMLPA